MAVPHLQTEVAEIKLLEVDTTILGAGNVGILRFQRYQNDAYTFMGKVYPYMPFSLDTVNRNMDLENSQTRLTVPNIDALRNPIKLLNGLRKCPMTVITIWPFSPDGAPIFERFQVLNSAFNGPAITFTLSNPCSAVYGLLPGRHYDSTAWKELPVVNSPVFS